MRRDLQLLRRLLLEAEAGHSLAAERTDHAVINRHVQLLAEAGYVVAGKPANLRADRWTISDITWRGHEVLDAIRSDALWQTIADTAARGVPFDLAVEVCLEHLRAALATRTWAMPAKEIPVGP